MASSNSQVRKNAPGESAGNPAAETTAAAAEIKKKKKVLFQVPEHEVRFVLSYKPADTNYENMQVPEILFKKDPVLAVMWCETLADMALLDQCNDEKMLEMQRDYREQLRTKGRVTYEIEVDEDDESAGGGSAGGARGRRRHRPAVA